MRRYHEDHSIIARRSEQARQRDGEAYKAPGRYRKTHIGCNRASCQLCHPEKFPKRIPTRKERQALRDLNQED